MAITDRDVRHVADLARLGLEPGRVPQLARELDGILSHMEVLQRSVPPETEPMASVSGIVAPLRVDTPAADPLTTSRQSFAPASRDGFFLVPRLAAHEDAGS